MSNILLTVIILEFIININIALGMQRRNCILSRKYIIYGETNVVFFVFHRPKQKSGKLYTYAVRDTGYGIRYV